MEWFTENVGNIIQIALGLVGVAAIIATMTDNTTDDTIIGQIKHYLNILAGNFGKAANATPEELAARKATKPPVTDVSNTPEG